MLIETAAQYADRRMRSLGLAAGIAGAAAVGFFLIDVPDAAVFFALAGLALCGLSGMEAGG